MRCGHRVILALVGLLMLLETGCLRRWRTSNPNSGYPNDPLLLRRDFPPGFPPPPPPGVNGSFGAGIGVDPGKPEVLTPQPPPAEPGPNGGMPPNASGYVPIPRNGLVPADHLQPVPRSNPRTGEEPPLARSNPLGPKPRVPQLPPDLLERRAGQNIAPAGVPESAPGAPVGISLFSEIKEKAIATGL